MGSPDINFSYIPSSVRTPGVYAEYNTTLAVRGLPAINWQTLIIAQMLASGNALPLTPMKVFSENDAMTYFGIGSQAHLMVRAALNANPYLQLTVIGLSDAGGSTAATGTITITGPATAAGILSVFVGSEETDVLVNSGDSQNAIAGNIVTALNNRDDLPVHAAANNAVVTLTALNKGTVGNQVPLSYMFSGSIAGVTCTIAAMGTVQAGAGDPSLSGALTVAFGTEYDIQIHPYANSTAMGLMKAQLATISGPMEQRPGIAVTGFTGTIGSATSLASAINDGRSLIGHLRYSVATIAASAAYEIAAAYGAVIASEPDPAMPFDTLQLTGITPAAIADRFSRTEGESLLWNGIAPLVVGPGLAVQIDRAISTYTLNAQSVPDPSLLDITTIRSMDYVRYAWRARMTERFPRNKQDARTQARVFSETYDVLKQLEELEIVENVDQWKTGILVEQDTQDPTRLDVKIPTDIVPGLHVLAARMDLILG